MSPRNDSRADDALVRLPATPSAVWVADQHGRFTEVNRWACRLLGYAQTDYLRRTVPEMIRPDEVDRLRTLMDDLALGGRVSDTWEVRHADGSYVALDLTHTFTADGHWESIGRLSDTGRTADVATTAGRIAELEDLLAQRDKKLESQPVIEQAKGILMRDLRFSDGEAFAYLVSLSQDTNVKLRTVAGHVVDALREGGISAGTARATFTELTDLRSRLRTLDTGRGRA